MSVEACTGCESGEELAVETSVPLGHDQQELPSRFQCVLARFGNCLVWRNAAGNAMTQRVGIALKQHLACFVQRAGEGPQPTHETPHQAGRNNRLVMWAVCRFALVESGLPVLR